MPTPVFRRATARDVPAVVALLADDPLGATRETPDDLAPYLAAFAEVDGDPGTCSWSPTTRARWSGPCSSRCSRGWPAGVRCGPGSRPSRRGDGLGATMVRYAVDEARRRGAVLVQLTSDRSRTDAHRFYERLGFTRTHDGFSLSLI